MMNRGGGGQSKKTTVNVTRRMMDLRLRENETRISRGNPDMMGVANMSNNTNVNIKYTVN